jgi:NAD(P)H-flavin reductase
MTNSTDISKLSTNISDNDGHLLNIDEIISELSYVYDNFDSNSMNDTALYLQGEEIMLYKVIEYLKRL